MNQTRLLTGEARSGQTLLLERIMGLRVELNHVGESSRQQQIRHDAELKRLRNSNSDLQNLVNMLQAENNTLRVQHQAALSVISYLEERLRFHLKSLLEQTSPLEVPTIGYDSSDFIEPIKRCA